MRGRTLVAEGIGTFALVFAGAGAVVVDARTHAIGHVGVAITFGLVIMAMIYAVGHISGAPLWLYVVAPLAGAALGAVAYQFVRGEPA